MSLASPRGRLAQTPYNLISERFFSLVRGEQRIFVDCDWPLPLEPFSLSRYLLVKIFLDHRQQL
jgi:hypothetical protein